MFHTQLRVQIEQHQQLRPDSTETWEIHIYNTTTVTEDLLCDETAHYNVSFHNHSYNTHLFVITASHSAVHVCFNALYSSLNSMH